MWACLGLDTSWFGICIFGKLFQPIGNKLIIHKEKMHIACVLVIEFLEIRSDKHLNKLENSSKNI